MDNATQAETQARTESRTQRVIIIDPQGVAQASATTVVNSDETVATVQIATANVTVTGKSVSSSSRSVAQTIAPDRRPIDP